MKKFKKFFLIFMFIILGVSFNVQAKTAPSSIKIKSKSSLYYYTEKRGTDYISGYNFYRKELTDGTLGYCVSDIDTKVPGGKTLTSNGPITDAGLEYIIKNGYPHKEFTGNSLKDYYVTQSAIWEYFDETRGSSNWGHTSFTSSSTGMKKYVYKLVQGAKNAKKSSSSASISLSIDNKTMSLSENNNYFVSSPITVNLVNTNDSYTVSLDNTPTGTIVKSTSGVKKTSFSKDEKFIIYVPVKNVTADNGTIKVKVKSQGIDYKVYSYSASSSSYQDIAPTTIYQELTSVVSKQLALNYKKIITKVKISKQDIASKEELPGATLVIKNANGEVVDSFVSTNTPHYIEGLKAGNYTLTETIAPNGYLLSSETISFSVKADGSVTSVVMYNTKENKTRVKISKQDITSKEELPGATLVIKNAKGEVVDSFVSTNTPHYIEGLKVGNYTLTETIAPNGYLLSSETISFSVKADGSVTSVVMYNEKYTEVPITDLDVKSSTIIGAIVLLFMGTGLVLYVKRSS